MGGHHTATPEALLDQCVDEIAELWEPTAFEPGVGSDDRQCLPAMPITQFQAAAASFGRRAASSLDGVRPRHFGMIAEEGMQAFILILQAVEMLGVLPTRPASCSLP